MRCSVRQSSCERESNEVHGLGLWSEELLYIGAVARRTVAQSSLCTRVRLDEEVWPCCGWWSTDRTSVQQLQSVSKTGGRKSYIIVYIDH